MKAQGATEYLVLLAVVLIIALVSVALLGFFPGMASDAQRAQSETYWKSASPIEITEWAAIGPGCGGHCGESTTVYLRLKNTGTYPIRITGVIDGNGTKITQFYASDSNITGCEFDTAGFKNISEYFYLGPGEEKYFGDPRLGTECQRRLGVIPGTSTGTSYYSATLGGARTMCHDAAASPEAFHINSIGFEYIGYIEGQQITKRQTGRNMQIACLSS